MKKAYTLGLYEKSMPPRLSWKEKLEAAKEAGYDFVEMSIDETDEKLKRLDMTGAQRLNMLSLMRVVGLPVRSMCLSGHRRYPLGSHKAEIRERALEIMEKAIRLADDLGIRVIQLAGYDVYYEDSDEETRAYFAENLRISVQMAAKYGVVLGFETMETEFMNTVNKAMEYVRLMASGYLSVYPDIGNLTNAALTYKTSVLKDLEAGRGHLAAMHLKETVPGVFREIPYGKGHVDFEAAIGSAWELGVRRFVTEFWYQSGSVWKEELISACRKMTGILDVQQQKGEVKRA